MEHQFHALYFSFVWAAKVVSVSDPLSMGHHTRRGQYRSVRSVCLFTVALSSVNHASSIWRQFVLIRLSMVRLMTSSSVYNLFSSRFRCLFRGGVCVATAGGFTSWQLRCNLKFLIPPPNTHPRPLSFCWLTLHVLRPAFYFLYDVS